MTVSCRKSSANLCPGDRKTVLCGMGWSTSCCLDGGIVSIETERSSPTLTEGGDSLMWDGLGHFLSFRGWDSLH